MILHKLNSKEFAHLRSRDSKTFKTKHLLFFYQIDSKKGALSDVSYGLTVTKKKVKNAVGRNRVKRLLREALRNSQNCGNVSVKVNIVYAPDNSDLSHSLCFYDIHQEVELFFSKIS